MKKGAEKLSKFLNAKQQGRLDGFFSVKPRSPKKDEESSKGKGKGAAKGKGTKRKVKLSRFSIIRSRLTHIECN